MRRADRRMPVKTADLDFSDDGYEGFHASRRTNASIGLMRRYLQMTAEVPEEEAREIILELFPSWDFVDEEGRAIPHTSEGIDRLPADLLLAMHKRGMEALRNGAMPDPLDGASSDAPSEDERG